ncbi:hypothetical protein [Candidatus Chloroploca sp. Khr17]|uniref:hypothetical protein n=1 Tax=Candidatus Chloroploca sp. Khr17 TaxID=2496869 RepID=UPI00101CB9B0|nr:hypothetical protein [Candidatus Chloroploca sp. Khr17]
MKALADVPTSARTPLLQQAIEQGAQFLLRHNLARAEYPFTGKISTAWFKLGFPLSYWSDILEWSRIVNLPRIKSMVHS